jgi:hypothetical protein
MRTAFVVTLVAALVPGCGWPGTIEVEQEPLDPVSSSDTNVQVDPSIYQNPQTSELGTDRTRGIAKTIEWSRNGTEMGSTFCRETIVVDHIMREDAENWYGVRVRLKNTQTAAQAIQWHITFFNAKGERLLSLNETWKEGDWQETWKSAVLDGLGLVTLTDACRLKGAVGFRLYVRKAGASDAGDADGMGRPAGR